MYNQSNHIPSAFTFLNLKVISSDTDLIPPLCGKSWGREVTAQREMDYPPSPSIFSRSLHPHKVQLCRGGNYFIHPLVNIFQ